MADGSHRSVDPPGMSLERHTRLKVVENGREDAPEGPLFAAATPTRIVLSEASDLWGVSPSGWVAALFLFGAVAAGGTLLASRATPPLPWPSDPVLVRLVFEEPAPASPVAEAAAVPIPSEPSIAPPPAPAEIVPPIPVQAVTAPEVEPEPPPIAAQPALTPLPKPPSRKPVLRQAAAVSPSATPSPVAAESPPATTQTAALSGATTPATRSSVLRPSLAYGAKPDYPAAARQRGLQGRVLLRIGVSADGAPADVVVITSSGHTVLDRAALAWVRVQRFRPAMRDGTAVDGEVDLPVEFRLED